MKREYTIVVDDREKKPLPFPSHLVMWDPNSPPSTRKARTTTVKLHLESQRLPTGDYLLKESPSTIVVERKNGLDEVAGNCLLTKKRKLFIAELERLRAECKRPVLLLEGDPVRVVKTRWWEGDPSIPRDALRALLLQYGVELLLIPGHTMVQRRAAASWIASMLILGAQYG